jgi:glycosyltransferase involved in cell wall biosynthesis
MILSVIVPFLDEEAYLSRSLTALLNQNVPRKDNEIVLVDNGSRDGPVAVPRGVPGITLIHHPVPNV